MSWYSSCFRQGFANVGGPYLKYFNARNLVKRFKEMGAELVYMDGIHQNQTLFPTKLSIMSPQLEGRDLVGEFTAACKEFGVRGGAYITPFEHTPFSIDHPEWCQTKTDDSAHEGPTWAPTNYWSCWNSPFPDKMCALIREMYGRYDLDAAYFDGLLSRHGVCHCPSCTAKFKADTGEDLPGAHNLADPAFREYLRWKDGTLTEACRRLVAATRVRNSEVQVVSNSPTSWCNWCAVQPVEFFDATEFTCMEVFPGIMDLKRAGYIHPSGVGTMAYSLAYFRGQSRGFPKVQCYNCLSSTPNFNCNPNFNTDLDMMIEAKSTIAMGGLLCVAGCRASVKPAFDYIRRCEPYLDDTKPLLWSALVASQESCNTQFDPNGMGESFFEDLIGSFNLMLDSRLPVEFVSGRDFGEGALAPYAVAILSDVGYVTPQQANAIREFVRQGGGFIATHKTGLIGMDGKELADFPLADVLGVHAIPMPKWESVSGDMRDPSTGCLCFEDTVPWWGDAAQSIEGEEYSTVPGKRPWARSGNGSVLTSSWQSITVNKSAVVHAWIRSPADSQAAPLPGIVENRFGKGRVIYISPRLGEMYARYPFPLWRRLMQKAVNRVTVRPAPVEVAAPLCVTAYAWEQAKNNRWIVHLINDLDQAGRTRGRWPLGRNDMPGSRPREKTIPVEGLSLIIRKNGATRAYLPLEGKELAVRKIKDGIKVRLKRMEQHAMIVVE